MSVLAIDAATTGVTASVVADDGTVTATAHHDLAPSHPGPGRVEHAPDELWRATLGAVREAVAQVDATTLQGVGLTTQRATVVLWDRETLGSPRPAIAGADRRTTQVCARLSSHRERVTALSGLPLAPGFAGPALRWVAEHEPRTWALVGAGRYAVGTVESYLVARMTRGLEHLTDVANASSTLLLDLAAGDWSDELCAVLDVPRDALPELVASWGTLAHTDPRSFAGLELPLTGLVGEPAALLLAGASTIDHDDGPWSLAPTGTTPATPDAGSWATAALRSPSGETTYAVERPLTAGAAPRPGAAVLGAAVAARRGLAR
ncbi:FGGY family carbohydrate kinase [Nocardioides rubriscoriae]|uniref:FGGY family carbohydrate kinase n=1 Tax=Nocardioides rubriscoriae TaxID=642762 RepID=UPI0011E00ABE|nr:FGGY family carbohydrate kinase [Nocardioides rubriscoriae]